MRVQIWFEFYNLTFFYFLLLFLLRIAPGKKPPFFSTIRSLQPKPSLLAVSSDFAAKKNTPEIRLYVKSDCN